MGICQFFMRGSCKFGSSCRYEHPGHQTNANRQYADQYKVDHRSEYSTQQRQSGNRYEVLQGQQQQQQQQQAGTQHLTTVNLTKQHSNADIVNAIITESRVWEESHMWPLSCYAYMKEGPCLSGFNDISPEELRCQAYECVREGNFAKYEQAAAGLLSAWCGRIAKLRDIQHDPDARQRLLSEIEEHRRAGFSPDLLLPPADPRATPAPSAFTAGTTRSLFGGTTAFGGGGATGGSVFGGQANVAAVQPAIPFGGTVVPPSASVFGKPAQSLFPAGGATAGTSLFGQGTFASSTATTLGLQTSPQQRPSLLGSPPVAPGNAGFGSQQPGGVPSLFGQATATTTAAPFSRSGFGAASPRQEGAPAAGEDSYTPLDRLTAAELEQYRGEKFASGKIPTRPPPRELVS
ncbi:PREDICTED: nucleoporin-like protein 2 [Priapulus caudatus]|uniref:Nucleoporin NUP42 n=1 Tax=Priapulus caudatus TaxID=37621 RepID=A0ABM1EMJ2_PRICU|nr:PREDICTED: nucleoporin-like protein 2 [Priapulus caudatus]